MKNGYLTKELRRFLCNDLIQSHFDYACPAWYPNSNEKTKKKTQMMQNKSIGFYFKLGKMYHISEAKFRLINWLPTSKRVDQCINTITYNFVNNTCPYYLNKIFEFAPNCGIGTRINFSKLKNAFRKTNMGQKTISYIGPSIWNSLPYSTTKANNLNTFKHNVKKHYLTWITHNVFMWICPSVFIYVYMSVSMCVYTYAYILVCLIYPCSCFFSRLPLSLIFLLTRGTTKQIRRFCPFCAIPAIAYAIHMCLQ